MSHANHPNADSSVTFTGYAAYAPKEALKTWSYNPPKLADDFVDIKISHCGICGSDIHTQDSGWGPSTYPVITGHEIIGTAVAVGQGVKHIKVGDRVGVGAQCGCCHDCTECKDGWQQHCREKLIWTYNSQYPDGQVSQGGYADRVRCDASFAFVIPEAISSAEAAPLMCAGATVFAPLKRYMTRPNMKVAIIGVGGLGHLAVKFASKLQNGSCDVTAVSHNSKKKEDALKMGAKDFIDTSDPEQVKKAFRSFDYILCTANGSHMDFANWLSFAKVQGVFCTVGIPEEPFKIPPFSLLSNQVKLCASAVGSQDEIRDMLQFCVESGVRPTIEIVPMENVNDGIKKVRDGSVRFRVVLENKQ